jgi:hypothetical protein
VGPRARQPADRYRTCASMRRWPRRRRLPGEGAARQGKAGQVPPHPCRATRSYCGSNAPTSVLGWVAFLVQGAGSRVALDQQQLTAYMVSVTLGHYVAKKARDPTGARSTLGGALNDWNLKSVVISVTPAQDLSQREIAEAASLSVIVIGRDVSKRFWMIHQNCVVHLPNPERSVVGPSERALRLNTKTAP